jgi:hypothetical protein
MKLTALADRLKGTKAAIEAHADELHARLDEIDKVAPDIVQRAHDAISAHQTDIQGLEDSLRELSNSVGDTPLPVQAPVTAEPVQGSHALAVYVPPAIPGGSKVLYVPPAIPEGPDVPANVRQAYEQAAANKE